VPTVLRPSSIQGLGLFAAAPILKGTVTWVFEPGFDLLFTPEQIEALPAVARALVMRHAYLSIVQGRYVYCTDDARFWNHSAKPNNGEVAQQRHAEPANIALRDIAAGEEMTVDYRTFDANDAKSGAAWLAR
jgi:SET domain-containing protein